MTTEKRRICIFIRSLLRGGAEKQSILLAACLKRFFDVHLVVLYPSEELLDFAKKRSVNPIQLQGPLLTRAVNFYLFLRKMHIDTLFCYLPSNNIVGGIIGKLAGVRTIFGGVRGAKIKDSKMKMQAQKFVCNHISDKFIANSEAARRAYVNYGYMASKVVVIPNMIDMYGMQTRLVNRNWDVPITIASVGRFVEEKDYSTALKALQIVQSHIPKDEFRYRIVGYGPLRCEVEEEINHRCLQDCVEIINGEVEGAVDRCLETADIFLITSKFEGMPNAVMEAMLYGLPVVATDVGDVRKLVISGETGFVCEVGDYRNISEKLLSLIGDREIRRKMGEMGCKNLKQEFSVERVGSTYMSLLTY